MTDAKLFQNSFEGNQLSSRGKNNVASMNIGMHIQETDRFEYASDSQKGMIQEPHLNPKSVGSDNNLYLRFNNRHESEEIFNQSSEHQNVSNSYKSGFTAHGQSVPGVNPSNMNSSNMKSVRSKNTAKTKFNTNLKAGDNFGLDIMS